MARPLASRRSARAGVRRDGHQEGRLGRADARQRARLRHPGAGAVQGRRDRGAARSDDGHARPRPHHGHGAVARAHHAAARRRRDAAAGAAVGDGAAGEPRVAPPPAGHAAHLLDLQEVADPVGVRRRSCSTPTIRRAIPRASCAPTRTSKRRRCRPPRRSRSPPTIASSRRCRSITATASTAGWRWRCASARPVPRGRGGAQAHRQAPARAGDQRAAGDAGAVRGAGQAADGEGAQGQEAALPVGGLARCPRRRPRRSRIAGASASCPSITRPRRRRSRATRRSRGPAPSARSSTASRCASATAAKERHGAEADGAHLGQVEVGGAQVDAAGARARRGGRRRRRRRQGLAAHRRRRPLRQDRAHLPRPAARISWSRSTASASRSARCRSASSRSPRCSRRRCA